MSYCEFYSCYTSILQPGTRRKARDNHQEIRKDNDQSSSDGSQVHLTERPTTAKGQRKAVNNEQQVNTDVAPKQQSPSPPPQNGLMLVIHF